MMKAKLARALGALGVLERRGDEVGRQHAAVAAGEVRMVLALLAAPVKRGKTKRGK